MHHGPFNHLPRFRGRLAATSALLPSRGIIGVRNGPRAVTSIAVPPPHKIPIPLFRTRLLPAACWRTQTMVEPMICMVTSAPSVSAKGGPFELAKLNSQLLDGFNDAATGAAISCAEADGSLPSIRQVGCTEYIAAPLVLSASKRLRTRRGSIFFICCCAIRPHTGLICQ